MGLWVVTSDSNLVNLDRYDDVTVMEPAPVDGVPNLGGVYQVMARKILESGKLYGQVLFEGDRPHCYQAASAVAAFIRTGKRMIDLQVSKEDAEANGQKPVLTSAEVETPADGVGAGESTEQAGSMVPRKDPPGSVVPE